MVSTTKYIDQSRKLPLFISKESGIKKWIYDHSTLMKVARVTATLVAIGLMLTLPYALFVPVALITVSSSVFLALSGVLVATVLYVANKYLPLPYPLQHSMKTHVFKEGSYKNSSLKYHNDVPILTLNEKTPHETGKAHGYLLAEAIEDLREYFASARMFTKEPTHKEVPDVLASLKQRIPQQYLQEIQGVVDGFNQRNKEKIFGRAKDVCVDELLLMHLMPDTYYFDARVEQTKLKKGRSSQPKKPSLRQQVACTVIVHRDRKKGMIFGRGMDWPLKGASTLLIKRKRKSGTTVEIGFPGLVGTLTGMKQNGFCVAMNVCPCGQLPPRAKTEGLPAVFFNRLCLDNCSSVEETEPFLDQHTPLGSYHLSVANNDRARGYHLFQGNILAPGRAAHRVREFDGQAPLVVTNERYDNASQLHYSRQKNERLNSFFNQAEKRIDPAQMDRDALVSHSLSLPFVDNEITAHKVVFLPGQRKMRVAFDNAYAGSRPMRELSEQVLFG